jgi:GNAT superfamily N-acetyltransferase
LAAVVRSYDRDSDEAWATAFLAEHLGGRRQARRGEVVDVLAPGLGLVAGDRIGLLTYRWDGDSVELTAIAAQQRGRGTGTALVETLVGVVRTAGASRIWVTTTNDNVDALAFYQRRGFRLSGIRIGAVDEARRTLKPAIPSIGEHGIELHDEIELTREVPAGVV